MQIIDYLDFQNGKYREAFKNGTAVTIGVFDGVHKGHTLLLQKIKRQGFIPVVVTFRENPHKFFKGKKFVAEIYPLEAKLKIFEDLGIHSVVLIDFCEKFRQTEGREFLQSLIKNGNMRYLAIGWDFRCGVNGSFTSGDIAIFAESQNVKTEVLDALLDEGAPVSSSRIRAAIASNDLTTASILLGREYKK